MQEERLECGWFSPAVMRGNTGYMSGKQHLLLAFVFPVKLKVRISALGKVRGKSWKSEERTENMNYRGESEWIKECSVNTGWHSSPLGFLLMNGKLDQLCFCFSHHISCFGYKCHRTGVNLDSTRVLYFYRMKMTEWGEGTMEWGVYDRVIIRIDYGI